MWRATVLALVVACQLPYSGGARGVELHALPADWLRAAPTPVVTQQTETDCGLAALAMVAGAWGQAWSVGELARSQPPDDTGVQLGRLRDLARRRGLDAYAIRGGVDDLVHELGAGRPVVLGLVLPFDRGLARAHYEVAVAMSPRDGTIVTIDPASGTYRQRSRAVLDAEWRPASYAALVVVGTRPACCSARRELGTRDAPGDG
jgi:ABC-type bacteriocin/lantibiotic exporter with double-glycine peptidase domain